VTRTERRLARTSAFERGWFYVRRAAVMRPAELVHRLRERSRLVGLRLRDAGGRAASERDRRDFAFCTRVRPLLPFSPAFSWRALGSSWQWDPQDPDVWRRAPDTGRLWPTAFFSEIDTRPGNPHGDARQVWEASRLHQLHALALKVRGQTGEQLQETADLLEAQLLHWWACNPPWRGVHYTSALECGLRIISICKALDAARPHLKDPQVWRVLVELVESHAVLIVRRLSLHSSAGNHTVGECVGLLFAGVLFPELAEASRWETAALKHLIRESERQVLPDGGGAEQAFDYHQDVVGLLDLACEALRATGRPEPPAVVSAAARGRAFLKAMATRAGLPPIGDSDDGVAFLRSRSSAEVRAEGTVRTFPRAGYTMIRQPETGLECVFDHGSLGHAPLFGHAHADALALSVAVQGEFLLIDPGTFSYADADFRAYFRGTRAHNTVVVDGRDQAQQVGAFRWTQPYSAELVHTESQEGVVHLVARHDGYLGLGVTHWRWVRILPAGRMMVVDVLDGVGEHSLELNWHCGAEPRACAVGVELGTSQRLRLFVVGGDASLSRGSLEPVVGWRSNAYGRKTPATTLHARYEGPLPHCFVTSIALGSNPAQVDISRELLRFYRMTNPHRRSVLGVPMDCVGKETAVSMTCVMLAEGGPHTILAVNPEKVMAARRDPALLACLEEAALLLPDGIGVVAAARLLGLDTTGVERIPGVEFMHTICRLAQEQGKRVFLFGAREAVNHKAQAALKELYPGLDVVGGRHGFLSAGETEELIAEINALQVDVLFVALGSPRQELWLREHGPKLNVRVCQGVGGSFDVLSGEVKRAPAFARATNLEWLFRLLSNPRRAGRQKSLVSFAGLVGLARLGWPPSSPREGGAFR